MIAGQVWLTWAQLAKTDTELSKQLQKFSSAPASQKLVTQAELNAMIGGYVVDSFRALTGKIPGRAGAGLPCRNKFSKYVDAEYTFYTFLSKWTGP